jgi:hypothetical protein
MIRGIWLLLGAGAVLAIASKAKQTEAQRIVAQARRDAAPLGDPSKVWGPNG